MFGYIIVYHRHHCTIKQTSLAQDKGRKPSFFIATILPNAQTKPFAEASFSMYIDLFRHTITSALPRTKKPHSVNALYGFYSTCCNLKVSVFQNFCNLVAFACKQKFTCAFRVFACTSSVAVNTAFARNPCSFWRAATVPQRLLGRVRPHRP